MEEPPPRSRSDAARSCRDKIRYDSDDAAERAARVQSQTFGAELDAYACPHCDAWHTGNTPRWLQLDREYGVFCADGPRWPFR